MSLQPLPQAIITASKLRKQAQELLLLAEELEASAPKMAPVPTGDGLFLGQEIKTKPRENRL